MKILFVTILLLLSSSMNSMMNRIKDHYTNCKAHVQRVGQYLQNNLMIVEIGAGVLVGTGFGYLLYKKSLPLTETLKVIDIAPNVTVTQVGAYDKVASLLNQFDPNAKLLTRSFFSLLLSYWLVWSQVSENRVQHHAKMALNMFVYTLYYIVPLTATYKILSLLV